jgi:hypothetical protein
LFTTVRMLLARDSWNLSDFILLSRAAARRKLHLDPVVHERENAARRDFIGSCCSRMWGMLIIHVCHVRHYAELFVFLCWVHLPSSKNCRIVTSPSSRFHNNKFWSYLWRL